MLCCSGRVGPIAQDILKSVIVLTKIVTGLEPAERGIGAPPTIRRLSGIVLDAELGVEQLADRRISRVAIRNVPGIGRELLGGASLLGSGYYAKMAEVGFE